MSTYKVSWHLTVKVSDGQCFNFLFSDQSLGGLLTRLERAVRRGKVKGFELRSDLTVGLLDEVAQVKAWVDSL